jgi:hypothetical protein
VVGKARDPPNGRERYRTTSRQAQAQPRAYWVVSAGARRRTRATASQSAFFSRSSRPLEGGCAAERSVRLATKLTCRGHCRSVVSRKTRMAAPIRCSAWFGGLPCSASMWCPCLVAYPGSWGENEAPLIFANSLTVEASNYAAISVRGGPAHRTRWPKFQSERLLRPEDLGHSPE